MNVVGSGDGFQHVVNVFPEVFSGNVHGHRVIHFAINGLAAGEGGRVTRDIRGKRFHNNISLFNLEVYFPKSYIGNDGDGELSAPGDFFLHYSVYDTDKGYLGHIVDVDMSTTNVLFVVERENGEELLIPATDDLVVSVDEKAKKIEMNIPEGLLDL